MVALIPKLDHSKLRQVRMFRDTEGEFWNDLIDAIPDGALDNKWRVVAILILRFVTRWDEMSIAKVFDIDIANVSRAISNGVRVIRESDREMLSRKAVDTVCVPVETLDVLIQASKDLADDFPHVDKAIRDTLNAIERKDWREDELSAEAESL